YVVDEENRAREREVETGIENNSYVEIVKGVSVGEEVITKGSTLVAEGTLVRVISGGAN
ncbi:MAG: efflux RND transporter periplasmic adaptor subunit, partial [Syntrophomonadaceae bacterium]|nr:efflux RND transporter periplasmic adaptor subunit [Syntrophomonadaceae bacterium]